MSLLEKFITDTEKLGGYDVQAPKARQYDVTLLASDVRNLMARKKNPLKLQEAIKDVLRHSVDPPDRRCILKRILERLKNGG